MSEPVKAAIDTRVSTQEQAQADEVPLEAQEEMPGGLTRAPAQAAGVSSEFPGTLSAVSARSTRSQDLPNRHLRISVIIVSGAVRAK